MPEYRLAIDTHVFFLPLEEFADAFAMRWYYDVLAESRHEGSHADESRLADEPSTYHYAKQYMILPNIVSRHRAMAHVYMRSRHYYIIYHIAIILSFLFITITPRHYYERFIQRVYSITTTY